MSKRTHTPGPWKVRRHQPGEKRLWIDPPGIDIDFDDVDHAQVRVDARLIAAAPDLLAACEDCIREYDESYTGNNLPIDVTRKAEMRAAIAKAKGSPCST